VVVVAKLQELSAGKMGAVVNDDGVRHSKTVDDVCEKGHSLFCSEICDRVCLNSFGELFYGDHQVGVAPGAFRRGPTMSNHHMENGHVTSMVCRA
jgi:hypothetical protein